MHNISVHNLVFNNHVIALLNWLLAQICWINIHDDRYPHDFLDNVDVCMLSSTGNPGIWYN